MCIRDRLIVAPGLSPVNVDLKLLGGDTVKIVVRGTDMYRSILAFVESAQMQFHTFTLKHVKPLFFMLRGLDVDSPLGEILDKLRELG